MSEKKFILLQLAEEELNKRLGGNGLLSEFDLTKVTSCSPYNKNIINNHPGSIDYSELIVNLNLFKDLNKEQQLEVINSLICIYGNNK